MQPEWWLLVASAVAAASIALAWPSPWLARARALAVSLLQLLLLALVVLVLAAPATEWRTAVGAATTPAADAVPIAPASDSLKSGEQVKPGSATAPGVATPSAADDRSALPWTWRTLLLTVWIVGFLISGARLIGGLLRARRLRREGARLPFSEELSMPWVLHPACEAPFLWPGPRAAIVAPAAAATWPPEWRCAIDRHEAVHRRHGDGWLILLGQLIAACYWFHPLVHWSVRGQRLLFEFACDAAVARHGDRRGYAEMLLALGGGEAPHAPVTAGAVGSSPLVKRIQALVGGQPHARITVLVATLTALVAMSAAALAARQLPSDPLSLVRPVGPALSSYRYHELNPGRLQLVAFYDGEPRAASSISVELRAPQSGQRVWLTFEGLRKFNEEIFTWEGQLLGGAEPTGRVRIAGHVGDGIVDGVGYGVVWRDRAGNFRIFRSAGGAMSEYPNIVCSWPLALDEPSWIERTPMLADWGRESAKRALCGSQLVGDGAYSHIDR